MKKVSKKTTRNLEEQRWVTLLTILSVAAVALVCVFVVWHAAS